MIGGAIGCCWFVTMAGASWRAVEAACRILDAGIAGTERHWTDLTFIFVHADCAGLLCSRSVELA
jgi:hypothetical protein